MRHRMRTSRGVAQSVHGLLWGEAEAEEGGTAAGADAVSVAAMAGGDEETERSDEHARETRD